MVEEEFGPAASDQVPMPDIDFRALAEASPDVMIQFCVERRPIYVSAAITPLAGWHPSDIREREVLLFYPEDQPIVHAAFDLTQGQASGKERAVFRILDRRGQAIWVEAMIARLAAANGPIKGFVMSLRDISERLHYEAHLERLSRMDPLTMLANRREFDLTLDREWAVARRERQPLSLLMIDLDKFKALNDRYGHPAGDDCLKAVADVLKQMSRRPADLAARIGGEEFVILLPRTHESGAKSMAEDIRREIIDLGIPNEDAPQHGSVLTTSIGVVTAACHDQTSPLSATQIIEAADKALYAAKQAGRNQSSFCRLTGSGRSGILHITQQAS